MIKRILQFRRLLEELNTFNPKKYLLSLEKETDEKKQKKPKKQKVSNIQAKLKGIAALEDQMAVEPEAENGEEDSSNETLEKRAINYTIAKNKGLTPYRKKEQRNPRVKHRMKFKKATVRRKGQVRKPRTETRRYDGEHTGIKMDVTKSIKFK